MRPVWWTTNLVGPPGVLTTVLNQSLFVADLAAAAAATEQTWPSVLPLPSHRMAHGDFCVAADDDVDQLL